MKQQHTPGPWRIETDKDGHTVHTDDTVVCRLCDIGDGKYPDPRGVHDARLIAAAPDLLAACGQARLMLTHVGGCSGTVALLSAAIAKAEGEP